MAREGRNVETERAERAESGSGGVMNGIVWSRKPEEGEREGGGGRRWGTRTKAQAEGLYREREARCGRKVGDWRAEGGADVQRLACGISGAGRMRARQVHFQANRNAEQQRWRVAWDGRRLARTRDGGGGIATRVAGNWIAS